ncbi:MAG: hypothetical protein IT537_03385 [Hyphomicrobiales bacterium]|nr:hypothetical protein [Hyphomicrobiales bacterium]
MAEDDPEARAMLRRVKMLAWEADVRTRMECARLGIPYEVALAGSPMAMIAERRMMLMGFVRSSTACGARLIKTAR